MGPSLSVSQSSDRIVILSRFSSTLALGYAMDDEIDFVTYMRQGVEDFLKPDEDLAKFLGSLKQNKYVFTNTREVEAEKALKVRPTHESLWKIDWPPSPLLPHTLRACLSLSLSIKCLGIREFFQGVYGGERLAH